MKKNLFIALFLSCLLGVYAEAPYNSGGVFILNEDWYGHNNSTLNHLSLSGQFSYRIIQAENQDTHYSLGCTAQYAVIYGGQMYIISKQAQDPGEGEHSQWRGGRVVCVDAKTMKVQYSIENIFTINGKSAADGRSFVGVDESKGYVGTSNGIFVLNLQAGTIGKRIAGTENPLITGGEQKTDGTGPLYRNQIGIMIRAYDYVFAIQQDKGIHVINPETDEVLTTISGCFSTMVQSKDGYIWAARNTNKDEQAFPYGFSGEEWQGNELLRIDPRTLEQTPFDIAAISGNEDLIVEQTWYAWTAGSLSAATQENALYFSFTENIFDWYNGRTHVYKYDIDNNSINEIFDTTTKGDYYIYNSGTVRVSPHGGNIYIACFKNNVSSNSWVFFQIKPDGTFVGSYTPIKNYWYPALFVFPDMAKPTVKNFSNTTVNGGQTIGIPLGDMASDRDHIAAAITKRVISVSDPMAVQSVVQRDTLWVTALANEDKQVSVVVRFNSNGQIVDKTLAVDIQYVATNITHAEEQPISRITATENGIVVMLSEAVEQAQVSVFDVMGRLLMTQTGKGNMYLPLAQGVYIVRAGRQTQRVVVR
ncbi:MAG: DUF5074 domain-containing protein [Paludibacteraceae bacterium]|nr:DUF5074 domain-containing protein [Paludibacteraceae bacterium]